MTEPATLQNVYVCVCVCVCVWNNINLKCHWIQQLRRIDLIKMLLGQYLSERARQQEAYSITDNSQQ